MLLQIPDVLDADALGRARDLLDGAPWIDGRATAGPQAATVKHNLQLPQRSDAARALQALVQPALERHPLFFSAALPKRILPPMFNRYGGPGNPGGHYGAHVDQAIRHHPDTRQPIRTDLSCTLFLSDPADYDGGELVVHDTYGLQRVKLPAGHLVLYPGTSVHRVEPVTRGQRLAAFFWVESLVRGDTQRALLFDMDLALMRLRERHGETEEAVALTGTYHNLLRLWSET